MTQTVLITGATDGIGLALAQIFAKASARLVLVGRRPLAETPAGRLFTPATYCQADLSRPGAADVVRDFCRLRKITWLDLLILNAGTGYVGPIAVQTPESISALVAVNLKAPIALTQALLPVLETAQGKVVFVSSVSSALPTPDYAVYTATKAALEGFARSLRVEMGDGPGGRIRVQTLFPGATYTGLHAKSGVDQAQMDWTKFPPAGQVAAQMIQAMYDDRPALALGPGSRLRRFAGRRLGGLVDWQMRRRAR